jgi:hypothetical protein
MAIRFAVGSTLVPGFAFVMEIPSLRFDSFLSLSVTLLVQGRRVFRVFKRYSFSWAAALNTGGPPQKAARHIAY